MTSHQTSASVFDRLYSKSTESSRLRKSAAEKESENASNVSASDFFNSKKHVPRRGRQRSPLKSRTNFARSRTNADSSEIYNRLYSKGTASYNSKRKNSAKPSQCKAVMASRNCVSNSTIKWWLKMDWHLLTRVSANYYWIQDSFGKIIADLAMGTFSIFLMKKGLPSDECVSRHLYHRSNNLG